MEVRMAKLEQLVEDHIDISRQFEERNDKQHDEILTKLDSAMAFQNRLQWAGGTVLLLVGSIAGWIIHNAHSLWDLLPKHGH